jgi:hypothetical protein
VRVKKSKHRPSNKQFRSLKIDVPPPAELKRAKKKILQTLSQVDWPAVKFSINERTDPEGWKRKKLLIEKIVEKLKPHATPGLSLNQLFNHVVVACCQSDYSAPAEIETLTKDLVGAAKAQHLVLGRKDLPPNYTFRICDGDVYKWNIYIECLERTMALTYTKPPRNTDLIKQGCAINAYVLIRTCTTQTPGKTRGGLFYAVTDLLYQSKFPKDDQRTDRLKFICDGLLDRVKKGFIPARAGL